MRAAAVQQQNRPTMPMTSHVSAGHAVVWLGVECMVLWILRCCVEGTFRFHVAGMDSVLGSACAQVVAYGLSLGAPFPLLRQPGYLGPSLYLPWMFYSLVANPVMIAVGLRLDSGGRIEVSWKRS